MCGYEGEDMGKRIYNQRGDMIEYQSGDTLEHSSYKLRHIYDSNGRRIEIEYYDPYLLRDEWTYNYEAFDDHGNWTTQVVTHMVSGDKRFARTINYRSMTYY